MTRNLSFASQAMRLLAAASLACTVATVGCSTDRTPGAGEPQHFAPSVGPTMPSSTPGTEQNRPVNPPMISSYTAPNAVMPRHPDLDALAVAAANRSFRGRYLGPADPGGVASYVANPQAANIQTGQFINPSDTANPEITINRSISSPGYEAISGGGDGGGGGGTVFVGTTGAVATTGAVTSAATLTPTTAGITALSPTAAANTVAPTTTVTNATAPVLNTRGGLLNPTITSGAVPSPTAAANRGAAISTATTVASTTNTTASTTSTATTAATTSALTTVGTGSGVIVMRNANGGVTITNSKTGGDGTIAPATGMTRAPLTLKTGSNQ
jgi:hypothetical protein